MRNILRFGARCLAAAVLLASSPAWAQYVPPASTAAPATPASPTPDGPDPAANEQPTPAPAAAPAPAPAAAPTPAPAPPAPAPAAPAAAPVAGPAGKAPAADGEPKRKTVSGLGIGFAWAEVIPLDYSATAEAKRLGMTLQYSSSRPLFDDLDFGIRFAWGLTDWERTGKWAEAGVSIGEGTTEAYEDTYNWTRKRGGDGRADPNTHGLRLMGGMMAMCFIWMGYVVSGVAFLAIPFAPTTFLELDFTANYVPSSGEVTPYLKAGFALFGFFYPVHNTLVGGVGPTGGAGVRIGELDLGVNATWSPPPAHGEARAGDTHLIMGGLTVGLVN